MPGNTIGRSFTLTTFGESHGVAIGGVIDGCPAGISLDIQAIQALLDKRRPGQSRYTTQRNEQDRIEILSGVFQGTTTGTPLGLLIHNTDHKSKDYADIAERFRPGHADYTYHHKYGIRDYRGGGRSSARETAIRVAAGAIAMQMLAKDSIVVHACVEQIGSIASNIAPSAIDWQQVETNPFYFADATRTNELQQYIQQLRRQGDSIGAQIVLVVRNVPVGLGEPVFDRLEADLAKSMLSIHATKAVSFGDGFDVVIQRGSEHRDLLTPQGFQSNHAGGVLGGISTGQDIIARIAFKPTSSITTPGTTVDIHNQQQQIVTKGRHDPCVGIRAVPIVQAMAALVIADHWLRQRATKW